MNLGQSSNDVIPTAMHLAALASIREDLLPALRGLQAELERKSADFMGVIKTGRTHLQDATPVWLGQEVHRVRRADRTAVSRIGHASGVLSEVALGGPPWERV